MLMTGQMVRAGGGRLMMIADIANGIAECVWFDSRGKLDTRDYDIDALDPFWLNAGLRSLWPEMRNIPDVKAKPGASTKPKKSRKIFR